MCDVECSGVAGSCGTVIRVMWSVVGRMESDV
jgi:hypothetical protein